MDRCNRCTVAFSFFVLYFSAQTASSFFPLGVNQQHETIPFYLNSRISFGNNNNKYEFKQYQRCETSLFASNKPYQVCILGGGFGGVNTALTLASLEADVSGRELEITLIDPKERFVFLPLLYELCVGDASLEEVAPTYSSLFHSRNNTSKVQWKQGTVIGVDVKNSCVFYNATSPLSMQKLNYDALVVCTGLDATPSPTIPGAQQFAHTFYTLQDCYALRKQLNNVLLSSSNSSRHVVVVGAGYSGVELSLNIRTFFQKQKADVKVTLVHRGENILPSASDFNRDSAMKRLKESNIQLLTETSVANVTQEGSKKIVQLSSRNGKEDTHDSIASDLLLWTVGANPPKKGILNSFLPRDKSERIMTRSTLQVVGLNNVFALGDCAKVVGGTSSYPATAQVAIQQAAVVAWNLCEVLNHDNASKVEESLLPFRYVELGEMMTLGTDDATINSLGGLFQASGKGASALRRFIYAVRMPTNKQRLTALVDSTAYLAANTILLDKQKRSKKSK